VTLELLWISQKIGSTGTFINQQIESFSIDSRNPLQRGLFFALRGDHTDGHQYLSAARDNGAVAAVIEKTGLGDVGIPLLLVDSVEITLTRLATAACQKWGGQVVGVTGSNGKTTQKEVIFTLLRGSKSVGKTVGNLNNHLGVPLTILRLPDEAEIAVIEMGMNHIGEIANLCKVARPDVAVVINVGTAHIEFFPDGQAGIARAKRELVDALPYEGLAVLNGDDARVRAMAESFPGRSVLFGLAEDCHWRAERIRASAGETRFQVRGQEFRVPLSGEHIIRNVLAGAAVADHYGVGLKEVAARAETLEAAEGRGRQFRHKEMLLVDDTYNSSPDAVKTMLAVLQQLPAQRRFAVLGEMRELGDRSPELHRATGEAVAAAGVSVLIGVRGVAREMVEAARRSGLAPDAALFFETPEEAGDYLRSVAQPGDALLFKGSRGTRMERALERFTS
jgi:UDP-N-acetylmuramoyl-tripeptide--D-alanyl-D-alanine ligase